MPLKGTVKKVINIISLIFVLLTSCNQNSKEDQVAEWISDHAIPINTVESGSDFDDLLNVGESIGDARIVSLGEPTHGNREVFQLKHRLVEYLVIEKGFNIFTLECPFGEALDINRYVVDGIGDPEKVLAGIYIWTWDTEEVLELIKWMRSYNSNLENGEKVKFYGFDPQDPGRAARVMLEYLKKVDATLEEDVRSELGILEVPFSDPVSMGRRQWIPEEYDSLSLKQIQKVMNAFDKKKENYVSSSSLKEWQLAKQHARQTEIYIASNINDGANYGYERDHGQAENIRWTLNHEGDASKIIVWAHNIHVSNRPGPRHEWMGYHIKKWYGDQVKIIGFFYNQGEFTAIDEEMPSQGLKNFHVGNAKIGSLEHMMVKANLNNAFLDLSKIPKNGPIYDWFNRPIPTRYSWGFYDQSKSEEYYWPHHMTTEFDALVFLNKTSGTRPINITDYENVWLLNKKINNPTNLDFEESNIGETPNGWIAWSRFKRLGVTMTTSNDAYRGEKSLMIHRPEGPAYGEIGPNLFQTIDATPYRGKKIRFKAVAKAKINTNTYAYLHLKIESWSENDTHSSSPPLFDSLDKIRIDNTDWNHYTIEANVPQNANSITYSINLKDFGTVWMDAAEIEVVEKTKIE